MVLLESWEAVRWMGMLCSSMLLNSFIHDGHGLNFWPQENSAVLHHYTFKANTGEPCDKISI